MSKAHKMCTLDNGSVPTASRVRQAVAEIFSTPYESAKDMSSDVYDRLVNQSANALKFTWVIAERLEKLGFPQGQNINNYLKRQRAYREKLRRHSEEVIKSLVDVRVVSKESADKLNEIGGVATLIEVNPFESRDRYNPNRAETRELSEAAKDRVEIDGKSYTKEEAWQILNEDIKNMDAEFVKAWRSRFGAKPIPSSALPSAALKNVLDSYRFYRNSLRDAIIQSYKDREGEGSLRDNETSAKTYSQIQRLKAQFAKANNDAYMSLLRSGPYVVNVYKQTDTLDENGNKQYELQKSEFFESRSEARKAADEARSKLGNNYRVQDFKRNEIEKYMYGMGNRGAINSFYDKLKPELEALKPTLKEGDPGYKEEVERIEKLKDRLHEMSLLLYPETSVKRQLVAKRKGTEGFIKDILKSYTIMADRYAGQISQIQYNGAIDQQLNELNIALKEENLPRDNQQLGVNLANELAQRVLNIESAPSVGSRFANAANQLGFLWFLGLNPASAMVNLLQVPGVTLPFLAARYGPSAIKELSKAYGTIGKIKSGYLTDGTLSERIDEIIRLKPEELKKQYGLTLDEARMLKELDDRGALRSGMQIYDINSVADMGGAYPGSVAHGIFVFQKAAGFMFQKAELINREVTALAAYRLAKQKASKGEASPMNQDDAVNFAENAIEKTQGAYSEDQAPRIFMNPLIRTVLMFKKFPAHMAAIYINLFKDMFRSADPAVKTVARRQFALMMGMSGLFSGIVGMPLYYIIRDIANLILGEEDEPYNFDLELRMGLVDVLGDDVGNMMFRGLLGESGLDIGSRVSYESSFLLGGTEDIPFLGGVFGLRDIKRGENAEETLKNAMFELVGPAGGIVSGFFRGGEKIMDGEIMRGVEAMSPAFLRNVVKSGRYATEGALTARGDPIVEDLTTLEILGQTFGFSPQRLSSQYKINNQIKDLEAELDGRRNSLLDQYAKAVRTKDFGARQDVKDEIRLFNLANPNPKIQITEDTLERSLAKRESVSKQTQKGIFLRPSMRERFAEELQLEDE